MTLEAQTEEPLTPLGYLDGAKGWARIIRDAALHPIPLGGVVVVVGAIGLVSWHPWGSTAEGARRWEAGGAATETESFSRLVKPFPPGLFSTLLAEFGVDRPKPEDGPILAHQMDWSHPHLAAYSIAAPTPPHPHPTIRDLGDNGQAHAIDFLAKYPASEKQSWKQLENALTDERDIGSGEKDPFRFDRILVATVAKGTDWDPGDRMMWTRVFVEPINFSFAGYTVAATENETVKLTSLEATNTKKISAEIGLAIPSLDGAKATLTPSSEQTEKTTSDINAQYEKLGIDIMPTFLRIIRESETGGNAVGNTLVSLSVVTDPITIQRRYPKDKDKPPLGDDVVLQVTGIHLEDETHELDGEHASITVLPQAPVPHCALRARIWMLYEQRHIDKGREHYEESRQTVSFMRDADEQRDVDFVSPDDVSPAVWSIQVVEKSDSKPTSIIKVLGAHLENGDASSLPRELVFTDYGQASKLAHWIRTTHQGRIKQLIFDYRDGDSLVPVKNVNDVCVPGYKPESRVIYKGTQ
jgi:hypothetical protein